MSIYASRKQENDKKYLHVFQKTAPNNICIVEIEKNAPRVKKGMSDVPSYSTLSLQFFCFYCGSGANLAYVLLT